MAVNRYENTSVLNWKEQITLLLKLQIETGNGLYLSCGRSLKTPLKKFHLKLSETKENGKK